MRFEVKRSEWVRGDGSISALLLSENNRRPDSPERKRCCLGFFANACGIPDEELEERPSPASVSAFGVSTDWDALSYGSGLSADDTEHCREIITCNDTAGATDTRREKELRRLFDEIGHEIVFVD